MGVWIVLLVMYSTPAWVLLAGQFGTISDCSVSKTNGLEYSSYHTPVHTCKNNTIIRRTQYWYYSHLRPISLLRLLLSLTTAFRLFDLLTLVCNCERQSQMSHIMRKRSIVVT